MEKIHLGRWTIEIDRDKTAEFYTTYSLTSRGCNCTYCRNFIQACEGFSEKVMDFFALLGIDPRKIAEVYECGHNNDETFTYGGKCHFVGRIVDGDDYLKAINSKTRVVDAKSLIEIDNFSFGFTYRSELVPEEFPRPVAELDFHANIPWVIDEKPENL